MEILTPIRMEPNVGVGHKIILESVAELATIPMLVTKTPMGACILIGMERVVQIAKRIIAESVMDHATMLVGVADMGAVVGTMRSMFAMALATIPTLVVRTATGVSTLLATGLALHQSLIRFVSPMLKA